MAQRLAAGVRDDRRCRDHPEGRGERRLRHPAARRDRAPAGALPLLLLEPLAPRGPLDDQLGDEPEDVDELLAAIREEMAGLRWNDATVDRALPLFLASGFCSLVYQVVWLRLGMASFGVNTAIVSIVLSVFMAGLPPAVGGPELGCGDRPGARPRRCAPTPAPSSGSGCRPGSCRFGLSSGRTLARASRRRLGVADHFTLAGAWLTIVLLPFCVAMGATIPLAMRAVEAQSDAAHGPRRSFSYLYAANVAGAALGTLVSAFVLIELLGFTGTLHGRGGPQFPRRGDRGRHSVRWRFRGVRSLLGSDDLQAAEPTARGRSSAHCSPPASSAWPPKSCGCGSSRLILGTMVYAFAALLAVYLVATFCGSLFYRALRTRDADRWERWTWIALPVPAVFPWRPPTRDSPSAPAGRRSASSASTPSRAS